jgi:hypothetical protein
MYKYTDWRPDFYFMIDHNMQNTPGYWRECILDNAGTPKYLWEKFRDGFDNEAERGIGDIPHTVWMPRCEKHHYYMSNNIHKRVQSWHLPDICTAIGGLSAMMQIAVMMGYEEIVLLGCDLGYKEDGTANHFDPNYTQDDRDRATLDNENMLYLHEMAKLSSPIPIYNGTIGGQLEVHKRIKI